MRGALDNLRTTYTRLPLGMVLRHAQWFCRAETTRFRRRGSAVDYSGNVRENKDS